MSYPCVQLQHKYPMEKKQKKKHDILSVPQSSLYFFFKYRKIAVKHFLFQKNQESLEKEFCMKDVSTKICI